MAERTKLLKTLIKQIVAPTLQEEGFRFDGERTFRKLGASGQTCQIINFQVGQRFMAGKFTINLGVYSSDTSLEPDHPALSEANEWNCLPGFRRRLGVLIRSRWTILWTRYLGDSGSVWWKHILYGPGDRWWPFSEDHVSTAASISSALACLQKFGLPWLMAADNINWMQTQYRQMLARVQATPQ